MTDPSQLKSLIFLVGGGILVLATALLGLKLIWKYGD